MRIADIDTRTEGTFFRCLHDEIPEDPRVTEIWRNWFKEFHAKGLRSKVLIDDNDDVVGLCQYLPIEHSFCTGKDMFAILCMWIHGYDHHIGNKQGNGYGRLLLEHIEENAKSSGMKGVAVWGKDFPYWNPISFYEHMGYKRTDNEGLNVLACKIFDETAEIPKIRKRTESIPVGKKKVAVTEFLCEWCLSEIDWSLKAREAVEGIEDMVEYSKIDISASPSLQETLYLDGKAYRPDGPPFTVKELRKDIVKLYKKKN